MFSTNPQYLLTLTEADRFDPRYDDEKQRGKCSLVIGMMQEHRRSQRHLGSKTLQIGFVIYKTNDPSKRLPQQHFMYNYDSGTSGTYINYREVTARFELDPGHYVIIPTTFKPGFPASFMIRVFAEKDFDLRELSHVIKQESGKKKHEKEGK
ncbi:PREDICTED: calpain-A-like [Priapulus caudatus]|uniref:Calpain-A-like n=1 Tax=Priapulus caudatus TaxID=37621 RepID=A0ABM1EXK8_PRICU|nr:PREDICTED: calpain-A-like [Priapulus caudatus]